jgi:hypothetical protein
MSISKATKEEKGTDAGKAGPFVTVLLRFAAEI